MEQEILSELIQIRWILLATFIAIILVILFFTIAATLRIRASNTRALLLVRDNYLAELSLLEAKGDYGALLAKSAEMLSSYPNDLMANWYSALANHKAGQLGAALSALGRIKEINSAWSADVVDDLISDIRSAMTGPRGTPHNALERKRDT